MNTIQVTKEILDNKIENNPTRFDMAINFYCCLKKDNNYYLVTYYYNPAWNFYYPFYDDKNKTPILQKSNAKTYGELISETNSIININLKEKLDLAHKRFFELFGCNCQVKPCKLNEMFELKHSKTTNLYSIYKFFNFIITEVEDINKILNPNNLKCELFNIENLDDTKVVSNAIYFCNQSLEELKENAIVC